MTQQKYEAVTGVNYRADTKRLHTDDAKIDIMSILRRCKKQHHVKNPSVHSAIKVKQFVSYLILSIVKIFLNSPFGNEKVVVV